MLQVSVKRTAKDRFKDYIRKGNHKLDLMMLPGVIFLIIFTVVPMYGIGIIFFDFSPGLGFAGSEFVGMGNFTELFTSGQTWQIIWNTFYIAILKIIIGFPVPIIFALVMNEIKMAGLKKGIQTIVYLPNFISWVVMAGLILDIFSVNGGVVNNMIVFFGGDPVEFLGEGKYFVPLLVFTEVWKGFGWGSVIYLAALSGVDPSLYESAVIDGAKRWQQTIHITIPGIIPIILLSGILNLGNILNAGFDQIYNLYNPNVS